MHKKMTSPIGVGKGQGTKKKHLTNYIILRRKNKCLVV